MKKLLLTLFVALFAMVGKAQITQISIRNSTGLPFIEGIFHADNRSPTSCSSVAATGPYTYLPTAGYLTLTASDPSIYGAPPTPLPNVFTFFHVHDPISNTGTFIYPCMWSTSGSYPFNLGATTYYANVVKSGSVATVTLAP